jgi:Flp pilus assembly protein TadG
MNLPTQPTVRTRSGRGAWGRNYALDEVVNDDRNSFPSRQNPTAAQVKLERHCRTCRRKRRGAAVVEFAVVAPVFILLIFGMIEVGRAIMVEQILTNAAREGARIAVLDSTTPTHDTIVAKVRTYCSDMGITVNLGEVVVNPTEPTASSCKNGDPVSVTVTVPYSRVSWVAAPFFMRSKSLTARAVMRRETVQ